MYFYEIVNFEYFGIIPLSRENRATFSLIVPELIILTKLVVKGEQKRVHLPFTTSAPLSLRLSICHDRPTASDEDGVGAEHHRFKSAVRNKAAPYSDFSGSIFRDSATPAPRYSILLEFQFYV